MFIMVSRFMIQMQSNVKLSLVFPGCDPFPPYFENGTSHIQTDFPSDYLHFFLLKTSDPDAPPFLDLLFLLHPAFPWLGRGHVDELVSNSRTTPPGTGGNDLSSLGNWNRRALLHFSWVFCKQDRPPPSHETFYIHWWWGPWIQPPACHWAQWLANFHAKSFHTKSREV